MELSGAGWSWVEVDGTGWRWVHSLTITKLYHTKSLAGKGILHFEEKRTVKAMSKGGYI